MLNNRIIAYELLMSKKKIYIYIEVKQWKNRTIEQQMLNNRTIEVYTIEQQYKQFMT